LISVDFIRIPHKHTQSRQAVPFVVTRLNALRLGEDGDLSCACQKIVVLNTDMPSLSN
jgi:hypothetical protein